MLVHLVSQLRSPKLFSGVKLRAEFEVVLQIVQRQFLSIAGCELLD